jgi:hypothetical protein
VIDAMRRQEAESGQPPRSISEIEQEMQLLKEIQEEDPPVPPENGEGTPEGEPDPGGSSDGGEDGGEGDGGGGGESEIVEPEEMLAPDEEDRPRPE